MSSKRPRKYRGSETGEYVSQEYAEANPLTTQSESDDRVIELEKRVLALEDMVLLLQEQAQK